MEKIFYGVFCDYSCNPVKRKIVEHMGYTIPDDETHDYYSITWFQTYEEAKDFLVAIS